MMDRRIHYSGIYRMSIFLKVHNIGYTLGELAQRKEW